MRMSDPNLVKTELISRSNDDPIVNMPPNQPPETEATSNRENNSVSVSIEPNHESEIYEIRMDGTEVYKDPLTYSENLAQLIAKIDFEEEESNNQDQAASKQNGEDKLSEKSLDEITSARKFYQTIYERVRSSIEEVSVLLDCLVVAKANKLLSLESGREHLINQLDDKSGENNFDKAFNIALKKRNIEKSKALLKKAQDKFNADVENINIRFHYELYKARQAWRIKKTGNRFNCDLSYRTVGMNAIRVSLELIKNEPLTSQDIDPARHQYLSVVIPDELKDYTYIQVKIVKSSKKPKKQAVFDRKFSLFTYSSSSNIPSWQEELEREQNSIYCKEIYNKMLREIFDANTQLPQKPVIMGNSMQIMITMEYDLIISLVHTTEKKLTSEKPPKDHNFDNSILEYYLHCLLKKSLDQNFFHFEQRPVTSSLAYNSQVKMAGMSYANLNFDEEDSMSSLPTHLAHLLNKKKQINILQSIKEKAEHLIIKKKVLKLLNDVSKRVSEPHLFIEQSAWNSSTSTEITVTISSYQFEAVARSFFYITIKQSQVLVLNRSANTSISFTESINDLKDYFLDQCTFHQINLIVTLSQSYGWTLLSSSFTNEANTKHMTGVGLIYNNKYFKKIGIKVSPVNRIELYVNQSNSSSSEGNMDVSLKNMLGDSNLDWIFTKDNFVKIDIDSYPGLTKLQKYELALAHYSTTEIV